jgi:hypothetical protein
MRRRAHSVLLLTSALAIATAAQAGNGFAQGDGRRTFTTALTGSEEAPKKGDPDGRGRATVRVSADRRRVCYTISAQRADRMMAGHIHEAPRGKAGPVIVPLFAKQVKLPPKTSGCATKDAKGKRLSSRVLRDIISTPADYYVNIHNAKYPDGALRGQLKR